jgi:hypothetical protein
MKNGGGESPTFVDSGRGVDAKSGGVGRPAPSASGMKSEEWWSRDAGGWVRGEASG